MIQLFVVGRLGKDAEVKTFDGGKSVINFSVAVDTGYGDKKETVWVDCAKWGEKTAVAQYLKKGQQVAVMGEAGLRKWDGGAAITLRVANLDLVGGKSEPGNSTGYQTGTHPADPANIKDDPSQDLPF